jgi:hypothetical protein
MPGKPKSRNWNDVQTAIATVAIVTTLGLWNLFATPSKVVKTAETREPVQPPPPTELPVEDQLAPVGPITPTALPQVKIMFTPGVTPVVQQQVQQAQQPVKKKKKKNNSNNNSGGSVSVTQTKTS